MSFHSTAAAQFYASERGVVAARLVRERMALLWPSLKGMSLLGIGYAAPYLRGYLGPGQASHCVAVTPAQLGVASFPGNAPGLSCIAEEDSLPFADLSLDRVLLVHGLEAAENARRLLREVWRVLKDDGRLIVIAPNRRGWWAYVEHTPFGQGQPYSPGQISRLLTTSMFQVEQRETALFVPPTNLRPILRGAALWERIGRNLAPHLAGVTITEASKDLYGAVPAGAVARRRLVLTEAG
jgi:SAM-dependent methyltransferase